jgi:hypothetical protein
MQTSTAFLGKVADVIARPEVYAGLRALATQELTEGTARESLMEWLEEARERFPDHEDTILDVMDCLAGWCGPHAKIDPLPSSRPFPLVPGDSSTTEVQPD